MEFDVWERIDASAWERWEVEQSGSSEATWLVEPETGDRWLHKDTKIPSNGVEQGEDWSEVVSTRVAELLGVPCAPTKLCVRAGRRGSLSRDITPEGHDLWEGDLVLETAGVPGFFPQIEGGPKAQDPRRPDVRRPGHSLENIDAALDGVAPPPGFDGPDGTTAFDVFAGYMVLDALIANPDRHEENWAKVTPRLQSLPEALAPSYDHASSLGYNLHDPTRRRVLAEPGALENWAERGRAARFEHRGTAPTLVEHAANTVELCSPQGADWVRGRLNEVDLSTLQDALRRNAIPGMSEDAARFVQELLYLNLRRLRDAIGHRS